jgi:NTE family protein
VKVAAGAAIGARRRKEAAITTRPAFLVLSGGGARGAFQVGAERVLRDELGFRWRHVFGVSVGALNATLIAQEEYDRLYGLWKAVREEDIYRKFWWLRVLWRVGVRKKLGFYDNRPLRETIEKNAAGRPFRIPVHVGRVSLVSGAYELVGNDEPGFLDAVWESTTMPIVWEPIGAAANVDGGLRNVTPLGDALGFGPPEIVVVLNGPKALEAAPPPRTVIDVAKRSLVDITINEILVNDVRKFIRINDLVKQAEKHGVDLTDSEGRAYRFCPITVIAPEEPLGDVLDFSPDKIEERLTAGAEAARKAFPPEAEPPRPDDGGEPANGLQA